MIDQIHNIYIQRRTQKTKMENEKQKNKKNESKRQKERSAFLSRLPELEQTRSTNPILLLAVAFVPQVQVYIWRQAEMFFARKPKTSRITHGSSCTRDKRAAHAPQLDGNIPQSFFSFFLNPPADG